MQPPAQEGSGVWSNTDDLEAVNGRLWIINVLWKILLIFHSEASIELPVRTHSFLHHPKTLYPPNWWEALCSSPWTYYCTHD